jgi:hypothetical protein
VLRVFSYGRWLTRNGWSFVWKSSFSWLQSSSHIIFIFPLFLSVNEFSTFVLSLLFSYRITFLSSCCWSFSLLTNHSLSSTASQGTSNIPFPCFLVLGCNCQAKGTSFLGFITWQFPKTLPLHQSSQGLVSKKLVLLPMDISFILVVFILWRFL